MFHLRQMRERSSAAAAAAGSKARNTALRNKQMRKAERKLEKEVGVNCIFCAIHMLS
jgi:hypothetical protein